MKRVASTVLLLFLLFLAAPTIVTCLEREEDTIELASKGCNPSSFEEIKHEIKYYTLGHFLEMTFFDSDNGSGRIIFENLSKHDLICATIFLPPPNMV